MPRATRSVAKQARHKKWIKRAKGYRGRRSRVFKLAKEAVLKAGQHAFNARRKKKSTFRQGWQTTINAAVRSHNLSYSRFMHALEASGSELDRKALAQLVLEQPEMFTKLVAEVAPAESSKSKQGPVNQ